MTHARPAAPSPQALPSGAPPDAASPAGRTGRLVVLGELNPDVLLDGARAAVAFGQVETEMSAGELTLGSSGAITAAAAATFGSNVSMVAVVGDDHLGRLAIELLADQGVDVSAVQVRAGLATGLTVVLNAPDGDRALLTYPGAMSALRVEDVPPAVTAAAAHVHISSLFLQTALHRGLAELLADLGRAGVTRSLDTGWDPRQDWTLVGTLLDGLDYLFPNEAELRRLNRALNLGADETSPAWVCDAAVELSRRGPAVAVKRGGHGGLLCTADAVHDLATTPLVPRDTTGAGDNFNAGFLHGVLTGASASRCLAQAVAAGTHSVQGRGGTGAIATPGRLRDVADVLERSVRVRHLATSRDPGALLTTNRTTSDRMMR